jgi:hypothetical protein
MSLIFLEIVSEEHKCNKLDNREIRNILKNQRYPAGSRAAQYPQKPPKPSKVVSSSVSAISLKLQV